ncbi:ROK family protein [Vallicoccus soli]|uniref:ROK family protein n=1 Tax=Vallicoccus soli TaxID=2339232 RepID=A0A3A3Z556_9ACTN|nr:ROK family protein [Vallicoccus soli]RJK98103.1 ROK family protein [Vallicoccus soli]
MPAPGPAVRAANLAAALRHVAACAEPPSRAGIAAATGFTRATASSLVDELVAAGLLAETAPLRRAGGGRPGTGLVLADRGAAGLGVEVNVDHVAACVVDLAGRVRHREVEGVDLRGVPPRRALARAARTARRAVAAAAGDGLEPSGAALALPGLVRGPSGPLQLAPNLGWRDVDVLELAGALEPFAGLALSAGNEADLAAVAELTERGPGASFLLVSGEVGIGAGVVVEGRLFRGAHGWAGELGHVSVDPAGPVCRCGARGCLERYAGQDALLASAGLVAPAGTSLGGVRTLDELVALAEAGDAGLLAGLDAAGHALGVAVSAALNLLDVPQVVLGGIYAPLSRWLAPGLCDELAVRLLAAPWAAPRVVASALGPEAAVVGAARTVVRSVVDDPAAWIARSTASSA